MKLKINTKGFTLIELLVVIAIIGLLASVVLASLDSARARAADAAIKSNFHTIKLQAESYYNTNGTYGTPFSYAPGTGTPCPTSGAGIFSDPTVVSALNQSIAFNTTNSSVCSIGPNGQSWAVQVNLKSGVTPYCIDSTGFAGIAQVDNSGPGGSAECYTP